MIPPSLLIPLITKKKKKKKKYNKIHHWPPYRQRKKLQGVMIPQERRGGGGVWYPLHFEIIFILHTLEFQRERGGYMIFLAETHIILLIFNPCS
jgi:hypothetical protein